MENEKKTNIKEKLLKIQTNLKAPKSQYNKFGKYNYRNCEDILEGLKPLLKELGCILTIEDEIFVVNERFYIKSTVKLADVNSNEKITNSAYAREEEKKTGMDASQVTGASSSYARKYALNGLFAIDDTKDADSQDNSKNNDKLKEIKNGTVEEQKTILLTQIFDKITKTETDREKIYKKFNVESIDDMKFEDLCTLNKMLNNTLKKLKDEKKLMEEEVF